MRNIYLRFRFDGARVLEIDPDSIRGFRIDDADDGSYYLTLFTNEAEFMIETGNFDQCHAKLNKLHYHLDLQLVDI